MEPNVILVTGTPGTGKTTISKLIASRLGARNIELTDYTRRHGLILGRDEPRDTDVVDMKALKAALRDDLVGAVVVDGHYSQDAVDPRVVRAVVVLRRAPWILKSELERRGYTPSKVRENVEAELLGVCLMESAAAHERIIEADTTGHTQEETLGEILRALDQQAYASGGIDWLSHPESIELIKELDRCT